MVKAFVLRMLSLLTPTSNPRGVAGRETILSCKQMDCHPRKFEPCSQHLIFLILFLRFGFSKDIFLRNQLNLKTTVANALMRRNGKGGHEIKMN